MAAHFVLIRHGAYALLDRALGGRAPHALSEAGQAQAASIAERLRTRTIAAVISSPVQRALDTAAPIAAALGQAVQPDPDFAEIDFGAWTGAAFDALHGDPAWRAWNQFRSTAQAPGGEAMLTVQARAVLALRRLAESFPNGEIVIVSHGDVIKAMLAHVLGAPLDLMRRMEIAAGSISEIALYDDDARVVCMNLPA